MQEIGESKHKEASLIEKQFWLLDQQGLGSGYNIICGFSSKGLDCQRFIAAVQTAFQCFEILSSNYIISGDSLARYSVHDELSLKYQVFSTDEKAQNWLETACQQKFELDNDVLVRLVIAEVGGGDRHYMAIVFHHIVIDLASKDRFGELVSALYNAGDAFADVTAQSAESSLAYEHFVDAQKEWLLSAQAEKARCYWSDSLIGVELNTRLSVKRTEKSSRFSSLPIGLSKALQAEIRKFCARHNSSPYLVLLAVYGFTLNRFCSEQAVVIGVPLTNRQQDAFKKTFGCFVNTLPVVGALEVDDTFLSYLKKIRQAMLLAHRHQAFPTLSLAEMLKQQSVRRKLNYSHGFTFEHPMKLSLKGCQLNSLAINPDKPQLELLMRCYMEKGEVVGQLEYDGGCYAESSLQRFLWMFQSVLKRVLSEPSLLLASMPYVCPDDLQLLAEANDTKRDYNHKKTLKQAFEEQVTRSPDALAVVAEGVSLTYRQFNQRANACARALMDTGLKAGDTIALMCPRSDRLMVAIYGIIKMQGIYVPIDTALPVARIENMLAQSESKALLLDKDCHAPGIEDSYKVVALQSVLLSDERLELNNPADVIDQDSHAYIIFTSGSTGQPKGVINSHRGIMNRMQWMQDRFAYGQGDVMMLKTPYSFDVSLTEILWPLQVGATLAIASADSHKDPYQLDQQIRDFNVNMIHFVPAMLASFLAADLTAQPGLRHVICSGEELTIDHQQRFFARYPDAELYNLYGPTEAAIEVTFWRCDRQATSTTVPMGAPVANTQLHVVDTDMNVVPVGVAGELLIAGTQVAEGYVGAQALTDERFVPNPFGIGKVYRTGDYVRWDETGVLEYLGRKDFQVKLNGLRIELAEIESALMTVTGVMQAVVTMQSTPGGSDFLAAYYTTVNGEAFDREQLIKQIQQKLPAYMLPSRFQWVEEFTISSSGKIDRKRLPALSFENVNIEVAGKTESLVHKIWSEVLGYDNFGVKDSFFDVGGSSLSLMRVYARLKEAFPGRLSSVDVFAHPNVATMAAFLDGGKKAPSQEASSERANKVKAAIKFQRRGRRDKSLG